MSRKSKMELDYSDIPPLDRSFWETARLVVPLRKVAISLRVDSDVLDWFKAHGPGYQSRMNNVLRSYVAAKDRRK